MVSRAIVTGSGHRTSTDGSRCATIRPAITCNFTKGGLIMTHEQLTVSVAIASWKNAVERADKVFRALTEDQYQHEIAPGRNRIIYLLGHLTAIHDRMHTILGLGERLHPELDGMFISTPDKAMGPLPPFSELTMCGTHVTRILFKKFAALAPRECLHRHTEVSEDDYAKDPTRNRLSVLLSRT